MRYEVLSLIRYSLELGREVWFRLTYEVSQGPMLGIERWFLVAKEELGDVKKAA